MNAKGLKNHLVKGNAKLSQTSKEDYICNVIKIIFVLHIAYLSHPRKDSPQIGFKRISLSCL